MRLAAASLAALCAVPLLSGCEAHRALRHETSYDPAETAWSKRQGTASISGNASWDFRGKRITCAHGSVSLVARSAYADESIRGTFGNTEHASVELDQASGYTDFDRRYFSDARKATCDAQGSFTFSGLPAGEYYVLPVIQTVIETVVVGGANYTTTYGMLHMRRVRLSDGQHAVVDFT